MRLEHDGIELWYGTEDAPAPSEIVSTANRIAITIGVHPADTGNRVEVQYRVNGGVLRSIEAKWFKSDTGAKRQYFSAEFPTFKDGDKVEYGAICRNASRQVPSPKESKKLPSSFAVAGSRAATDPRIAIGPRPQRLGGLVPRLPLGEVPLVLPPPPLLPAPLPTGGPAGLQTRELVMIALPVVRDQPPNQIQPKLIDGIHLRWAFSRNNGFPWYGFYLFRRGHLQGDPICLSRATGNLSDGRYTDSQLTTTLGSIISDQILVLTDKFPRPPGQTTGGFVEFDLSNRGYLRFETPNSDPARRVEVRIGFIDKADLTVTAQLWGIPIAEQVVSGNPGDVVTALFEYDSITEINISSGPAVLIDVCYVLVAQDAQRDWAEVPNFDYPMRLPLTHPNYPCTPTRPEDLAASRDLARRRIHYGDPTNLVSSQPVQSAGAVNVTLGSAVIIGVSTGWSDRLAGDVIQVELDNTAYAIIEVISPTKLVVSRPYVGATRLGARYAISQDSFGQLHDYLANLVTGGTSPPMARRVIPSTVYGTGSISVNQTSNVVTGAGTNWVRDYEGLTLQVLAPSTGTVFDPNAAPVTQATITGVGTNWTSDLDGLAFRVEGDDSVYSIIRVDSPVRLILDRHYAGTVAPGRTYSIFEKTTYSIARVDSATQITLDRPYGGRTGPSKPYRIAATLTPDQSGPVAPSMPRQHPLDLVLMAALNPAIAQAVGLYWIDTDPVDDGVVIDYDYLIVADYGGRGNLTSNRVLDEITTNGFTNLLGWIVFKKSIVPAPPMAAPDGLEVYALPGATTRSASGDLIDAINNAGLRWNLGLTNGALVPGKPLMYHLWRAGLGDSPDNQPEYRPLTEDRPLLINESRPLIGEAAQRPPDWPPFALYTIDRALPDGWYSYQVSGIDIFGRHSRNSFPATWRSWEPPPEPLPWYYQDPPVDPPPAPPVVHPTAIWLRSDMPPPPPIGVEAYALDPLDRLVLKDEAYNAWWNSLTVSAWYQALSETERNDLIGLRVTWLWTHSHMAQAPNTREFRIYYQAGQLNALLGRTAAVSTASPTESWVDTDLTNTRQANAYVGAWLRIGNSAFRINGSEASAPLRLRVRSGPVHSNGTIVAEHGNDLVRGMFTLWDMSLAGLTLTVTGEETEYTIMSVNPAMQQLRLNQSYRGVSGSGKFYRIAGRLPQSNLPCTVAFPPPFFSGTVTIVSGARIVGGENTNWHGDLVGLSFGVAGDQTAYTVAAVNSHNELELDQPYAGPNIAEKRYVISHPLFIDYAETTNWQDRYHVVNYDDNVTEIVPPLQSRNGNPLSGSNAVVMNNVVHLDGTPDLSDLRLALNQLFVPHLYLASDEGRPSKAYRILEVDDLNKTVTVDAVPNIRVPTSAWTIGFSARRYQVFLPEPAGAFHNGLQLNPTMTQPVVYAHIGVTAADDKQYVDDDAIWEGGNWGGAERYGNESGVSAPAKIFRVLRRPPPVPELPPFDSDRLLATPADYHGHSFYTYHWQPAVDNNTGQVLPLKCHIFRALDDAVFRADWLWRRRQNPPFELSPGNPQHLEKFFPRELRDNQAEQRRIAAANAINQLNSLSTSPRFSDVRAVYRSLSNDALRVLAGLPGSEPAFTQLTILPLDPFDPVNADRRGPDDRADYPESADRRAYIDTLDGRTSNYYFYRSAFVDGAHNRSDGLSLATPPVFPPDVVPPRTPVFTKVLGAERHIVLRWASNREPDLAEYRIYRNESLDGARDLRLMTLAYTEAAPQNVDPMGRPAELSWEDRGVVSGRSYWYRIVALDASNNVSTPSQPVEARAYRIGPPPPPEWRSGTWTASRSAVQLEWTSSEPGLQTLIQRRSSPSARWVSITSWLASNVTAYEDAGANSQLDNYYRIKTRDQSGNISVDYVPVAVLRPAP